ncbi:MAG: hypothetical protein PVI35_03075 [Acidimicrobiia bacterium]
MEGLDLTLLADELRQEFTKERFTHRTGRVVVGRIPLDLGLLAGDVFEIYDEDEAYEEINAAAGSTPLATFHWEEDGAQPWANALDIIPLGDRTYVAMAPDVTVSQDWEAIAAVEPPGAEILEAFFLDLIADNGVAYGIDLFSSLPTRVVTEHLTRQVVTAAFAAYLDWDERRNPGAWRTAAEYLPESVCHDLELRAAAVELVSADTEANRRRYIDAYGAVVFEGPSAGAAATAG